MGWWNAYPRAAALYLFLVTVADAQGLSYYGAATLAGRLHLSMEELDTARSQLIAYQAALYQVLSLSQAAPHRPPRAGAPVRNPSAAPVSLAQLIKMERERAGL